MDEAGSNAAAEVVISGPGHHDRAERALPVIAAISTLGVEVVVRTDLRPRLADDVRALLDAGAARVRLEADGIAGDLAPTGVSSFDSGPAAHGGGPGVVVVVLRAGSASPPVVSGDGRVADSVRAVLDALTETAEGADENRD